MRADSGNAAWLATLVRTYPNVLVIDVGELLRQVQSIMDQVARAVEFVFLFTLAGGLLVLQAAIASTQDERQYDAAVLRTLGFDRRQVRAAVVWQATTLAAVGVALGIPAGIVVGRLIWRAVADGLGVSATPTLGPLAVVLVAAATMVVVNLVARPPARAALRAQPAVVLRSE